jgi:hypothetical protein
MKTLRIAKLALIACLVLAPGLLAEPVRTVRLSPANQGVNAGDLLPSTLSFRVERANGEPISGLTVNVTVDLCIPVGTPPPGFTCPTDAEYGGFEPAAALAVDLVSNAQGIVTAPAYKAGLPEPNHPHFEFRLVTYVPPQVTGGGVTVSPEDASAAFYNYWDSMTTVRVAANGEGVAVIPAIGGVGLTLLIALLGAAAMVVLRRR